MSSIQEWDAVLRELADDPADYERDGGLVVLERQGQSYSLTLNEEPGSGICVSADSLGTVKQQGKIPIATYIQRYLLGLPRLATQIIKTLEKSAAKRPVRFIEGPAEVRSSASIKSWPEASREFRQYLCQAEPGTTGLIQLMAAAGQGKTVLLENLAIEFAKGYTPDEYPTPILLTVDLLGRYVGTVEDAIAGTLNNTYVFTGLTQRDVVQCIRRRWLILALDGFDELVARVGTRESFLRITELLDQLRGAGTLILSARESFFELFQITASIRSYLQPKVGSYKTSEVRLLPWTRKQGEEVFQRLESPNPGKDLAELLNAFGQDDKLVFHPFFLTRLAELWRKGERFVGAGKQTDQFTRTKYVIETFIQRESKEKWIDREGNALLSPENHSAMLGTVAEEMWRSGAFKLGDEELKIAAEFGIEELGLPRPLAEQVLAKIPTHAAFQARDRKYTFLHDQFLHYFLGYRIAKGLKERDKYASVQNLAAREFSPEITDWVVWNWRTMGGQVSHLVAFLNALRSENTEGACPTNIALLFGRILNNNKPPSSIEIVRHTFLGEVFRGGQYFNLSFRDCEFWHLDITDTRFHGCAFVGCRIGDVLASENTTLDGTYFEHSDPASVEIAGEDAAYSPEDVRGLLTGLGAKMVRTEDVPEKPSPTVIVRKDVVRCVEKYLKASGQTWDIAIEDMEEHYGSLCGDVAKIALKHGVFKSIQKDASGPRKTFVRFKVDREKLLPGQLDKTDDVGIDAFWDELKAKYGQRVSHDNSAK